MTVKTEEEIERDKRSQVPAKTMTFKEKMTERIRESIGDLISDEELSKSVDEGIRSAFFERKQISGGYSSDTRFTTPLINDIVINLMKPAVEAEVKVWFVDNEDEIGSVLHAVIKDGIVSMLTNAINNTFRMPLYNLQSEIADIVRKMSGK